jgi:hypothetical protein
MGTMPRRMSSATVCALQPIRGTRSACEYAATEYTARRGSGSRAYVVGTQRSRASVITAAVAEITTNDPVRK